MKQDHSVTWKIQIAFGVILFITTIAVIWAVMTNRPAPNDGTTWAPTPFPTSGPTTRMPTSPPTTAAPTTRSPTTAAPTP